QHMPPLQFTSESFEHIFSCPSNFSIIKEKSKSIIKLILELINKSDSIQSKTDLNDIISNLLISEPLLLNWATVTANTSSATGICWKRITPYPQQKQPNKKRFPPTTLLLDCFTRSNPMQCIDKTTTIYINKIIQLNNPSPQNSSLFMDRAIAVYPYPFNRPL
ncbi:10327_t:CDS:2, partial [Acaulospora colombiana]